MPATLLVILIILWMLPSSPAAERELAGERVSHIFKRLTRQARWRRVDAVPLRFNAHHPQGMVRIGHDLYVSSVEVTRQTRPLPTTSPRGRYDRDEGAGVGHLFRFNLQGELISDLKIGEGPIYHPGGIDFDGRHLWVAVAEYRPDSRSIVYRIDPHHPERPIVREIARVDDHLGGIAHWIEARTLFGISWGSRRFLQLSPGSSAWQTRPNRSFYIDYQDCHYLGRGEAICGGLRQYRRDNDGTRLSLGGIELLNLRTGLPIHQLPVEFWTDTGRPLTQNPFWLEPLPAPAEGLRAFFLPEDGQSTLLVYEITVE
jgi:hypothetical protein